MILDAFSHVLHREHRRTGQAAQQILHCWLLSALSDAEPQDTVAKVLHTEIAVLNVMGKTAFSGKSKTGETLLNSLYLYCESYEQWQFRRWLHEAKPHYFNQFSC